MEVSMEVMHVRFASPSADITQDAMYKPTTTHGTFCYQSSYIYQKHITQYGPPSPPKIQTLQMV